MPSNRARLIGRSVSVARRAITSRHLEVFCQTYLQANCKVPFSILHKDLFLYLEEASADRGARRAVAAPRGHAKSTVVSLAYVLWCLLTGREQLIMLVSATAEQAKGLLAHVRNELERNPLIREDYPELYGPDGRVLATPWRDRRFALANGGMLMAYGAHQGLRGARHGSHRPGLIICDDLEDKEQVISEEQRIKLKSWFTGTLLNCGHGQTNVVVVGTVLHHESLLAELIDEKRSPGWMGERYQAIIRFSRKEQLWERWATIYRGDESHEGCSGPHAALAYFEVHKEAMLKGALALWPQWESYYDLMVMREREGRMAFMAEKQNEPLDPDQCIFALAELRYWDDDYEDEAALLKALGDGEFFGACDPSLGKKGGDFSAIIILYRPLDSDKKYVIAADLALRTPDKLVDRMIQYARMYGVDGFAVESNQFQQLLVDNLERRAKEQGVRLFAEPVEHRTNKEARISALEPEVSQGRLLFSRRHRTLMGQLLTFPMGSHDDGPDALEMAVELAENSNRDAWVTEPMGI